MKRFTLCLFVALACSVALPLAADAFKQKEPAGDGYTLVLFPIKVIANWGDGYTFRTETDAVEGIANMATDNPLLGIKYAYLEVGDFADTILLEDAVGGKDIDVWRQTSLLSSFSPNWHQVKAIGSEIAADLAILIRIRAEDSLLVIYLYDLRMVKNTQRPVRASIGGPWQPVFRKFQKRSCKIFMTNSSICFACKHQGFVPFTSENDIEKNHRR
jgi:hypothetical protein